MATLRQRLNRKNAAGGYDAVHLETSSDLVLRPDGTTVEYALSNVKQEVTNIVNQGITPTSHAAEHATGGKDPITPAAIGAAPASHSHSGYAASSHTHDYAGSSTPGGAATTAVKLQNQRTFKVNLESTSAVNFDGSANVTPGVSGILPKANGGTGNANGTADKLTTGRTIRVNLASTSAPSFDGSGNITPGVTGVLPVANGGTGASSLASLGSSLVDSGTVASGASGGGVTAAIDVGSTVAWAGYNWRVVHVASGLLYLAFLIIYETCQFGSNNTYKGSNLAARAKAFENTLPATALAKAANTTVNGVTAKIFVPSYEQMNGGFSYFNSNDRRICQYNGSNQWYWTSSPGSGSDVCHVNAGGSVSFGNYPTAPYGFRPFVAVPF